MRTLLPIILVFGALGLGTWMGLNPLEVRGLGPTMRADFLDVGHGESVLVRTPDGANALVDAGDDGRAVVDFLKRNGVERLDYVVLTVPRAEHIGGLPEVLDSVQVGAVLEGCAPVDSPVRDKVLRRLSDDKVPYSQVRAGTNIALGKTAILQVLAPQATAEAATGDPGDASAVVRVVFGRASILLPGDLEDRGEAKLIAAHSDLSSQVLLAADHGSSDSTSLELLRLVRPEYIVISAGGNGYPSRRTIERLSEERTGAALFRTDKNGTVTVQTDGRRIAVEAER